MKPPAELLAAFRASEQARDIAVLLVDDSNDKQKSGFDAVSLRILASWQHSDHRWIKPKAPQPDSGMPTPKAWLWLWSGYRVDLDAVARGAGVSVALASERFQVLKHNRLIYPDGSCSRWLEAAITTHVAKRLNPDKPKRKTDADKSDKSN